jgi:hypothetical protein
MREIARALLNMTELLETGLDLKQPAGGLSGKS